MKTVYNLTFLLALLFFTTGYGQEVKKKTVFLKKFENSETTFVENNLKKILDLSKNDRLSSIKHSKKDKLGYSFKQYEQYYSGIKVEHTAIRVHRKGGKVHAITGEYVANLHVNIVPEIDEVFAFQRAMDYINAESYIWDDSEMYAWYKSENNSENGELVICKNAFAAKNDEYQLAYKFDIYALTPLSRSFVYISAQNGEVLLNDATIKHAIADTRYSGGRLIYTKPLGGDYILKDELHNIQTKNMNNGISYVGAENFVDNNDYWTDAEWDNSAKDNAALDAHWGAERTYTYFNDTFGRDSYDNAGAPIRNYVHYSVDYVNAFWNGNVMTYGDGDVSCNPLTSVDIVAHEIGHAICDASADLVYFNESGALNESFSDIWAACVEHFADDEKSTWEMGEDIGCIFRSMENPNEYEDPDTYRGDYWLDYWVSGSDNGGVHTNSGVQNHWFYLLSQGGSGINDHCVAYNVSPIGIEDAAKIAYRTETVYLSPYSGYVDARNFSLQAAKDIFGLYSDQWNNVHEAWRAVGVDFDFDIPIYDDIEPYEITEDTVWNLATVPSGILKINNEVHIKNGASLTIDGITVEFADSYKENFYYDFNRTVLIVEQGGRLIVENGALLTSLQNCDETTMWEGIEVWGNSDESQTYANQGWVILKNATISNAHIGVTLWKPGNWDETGGVIKAYNSTFINNRRSVAFMNYTDETYTGRDKPNKSEFRNVDFIWGDEFNHTPLNHVSLYKVSGVRFGGCHFSDNRTGDNFTSPYLENDGSITKCGIRSIDARYFVNASTFTNLDFGIYASNSSSIYPISVSRSIFRNNLYGIETIGLFSPKVTFNKFHYSDVENYYTETSKYGIHLVRTQDLSIEENEFINVTPYEDIGTCIGIVSSDLGQNNEMIRKNTFKGLTYANLTQGENRGALWPLPNGSLGLSFECNINQYNSADFRVSDTLWGGFEAFYGIKGNIGSYDQPAGNTFSEEPAANFINDTGHYLNYYYKDGAVNQEPLYTSGVNKVPTSFNVSCETNFPYHDGELGFMQSQFHLIRNQLSQLLQVYEQQVNQGNPDPELENEIINLQSHKSQLATSILSILYNVDEFNGSDIKDWIIFGDDTLYKTQLIDLYIQQLDFTNAYIEINNLRNELTTYPQQLQIEISDFIRLKELIIPILSQGNTLYDLSQNTKNQITGIADNGKGLAKYQAQEILCFFFDQCISRNLTIPQGGSQSSNKEYSVVIDKNNISIFPNPASDIAIIYFKDMNMDDSCRVEIFNLQGQKLKTLEMKEQKLQFDISDLSSGLYLIKVSDGINTYTGKLLKE